MVLNRLLTALLCLGAILLLTGPSPSARSSEKEPLIRFVWANAVAHEQLDK